MSAYLRDVLMFGGGILLPVAFTTTLWVLPVSFALVIASAAVDDQL